MKKFLWLLVTAVGVSPDTVKGNVRQALVKFHLSSKDELRMPSAPHGAETADGGLWPPRLVAQWDFSEWGPPARPVRNRRLLDILACR
jgi:hypothetical protein